MIRRIINTLVIVASAILISYKAGSTVESSYLNTTKEHTWIQVVTVETNQRDNVKAVKPLMESHTYCKTCLKNRNSLIIFDGNQQGINEHKMWHINECEDRFAQIVTEKVKVGNLTIYD